MLWLVVNIWLSTDFELEVLTFMSAGGAKSITIEHANNYCSLKMSHQSFFVNTNDYWWRTFDWVIILKKASPCFIFFKKNFFKFYPAFQRTINKNSFFIFLLLFLNKK